MTDQDKTFLAVTTIGAALDGLSALEQARVLLSVRRLLDVDRRLQAEIEERTTLLLDSDSLAVAIDAAMPDDDSATKGPADE